MRVSTTAPPNHSSSYDKYFKNNFLVSIYEVLAWPNGTKVKKNVRAFNQKLFAVYINSRNLCTSVLLLCWKPFEDLYFQPFVYFPISQPTASPEVGGWGRFGHICCWEQTECEQHAASYRNNMWHCDIRMIQSQQQKQQTCTLQCVNSIFNSVGRLW